VGQDAAGQELAELALDERGQVTALIASLGRAEERVEMLTDDPVEHGVFGVARTIHRLGWRHAQG
jgi:hypothetical protein